MIPVRLPKPSPVLGFCYLGHGACMTNAHRTTSTTLSASQHKHYYTIPTITYSHTTDPLPAPPLKLYHPPQGQTLSRLPPIPRFSYPLLFRSFVPLMMRPLKPCVPFKALSLPSYPLATLMSDLAVLRLLSSKGKGRPVSHLSSFTFYFLCPFYFVFVCLRQRFNCASSPIGGNTFLRQLCMGERFCFFVFL